MPKPRLPKAHSLHVTLRDVAKDAGVSIKTVSRVVNNQGEISKPTRRRVQSAIERLGYHPNILARSLVNQRSDALAVVAWGIDYFGPSRTVLGVEQQSNELGYSLFLNLLLKPDDPNIAPILDGLASRRVDGIIWAVPEVGNNHAWVRREQLASMPPTVFLSMQPRSGIALVTVDNRAGAAQATQHLIDQGKQTIGVIAGPQAWWEARERVEGWKETMLRAGLRPAASLVVEGDWSAASGEEGMRKLLTLHPEVDAVFACNDQMALGALGIALRSGRRVPQDLAVIGFDNTPESGYYWPPLTTVYQHLVEAGRLAVQMLHGMIQARLDGKTEPALTTTVLTPELLIRQSSLVLAQPLLSTATV